MRVNLGAGLQAYEHPGYINVDAIRSGDIHIVWNCENGLPRDHKGTKIFDNNSVDEFLCKHFLEHLSVDGFMRLMDEMWDALVPNGVLHIFVPNAEHIRAAYSDPTHRKVFTVGTFEYFTKEMLAAYPYTTKAWRILEGYPKVNGTAPDDLWEIEVKLQPCK